MKTQTETVCLDHSGVDSASAIIQNWLEAAGLQDRDILRIRLAAEELLTRVSDHGGESMQAELIFKKGMGDLWLYIRYGGERFDPTAPKENGIDEWTADLLVRTGSEPAWRWHDRGNELLFRIPVKKRRPERIMLFGAVAAVVIGLLGQFLPETLKTGVSDYVLSFLSEGFLHLLGAFIGLMIFLSVVTGICGIGSSANLGRIGKLMISRFVGLSFIYNVFLVFAVRFFFPLSLGTGSGNAQIYEILKIIFDIIPSNPIQPFLDGNTLQIVFLASIVGAVLLLTGSQTEGLRSLFSQADALIRRCVTGVCMFLPVYIISSLIMLFWRNGTGILLLLWKPLVVCAGFSAIFTAFCLVLVSSKFKVKISILVKKLMPDFLITLSTASSSVAFPTSMEINEKKLGIDPAYARTALPIGCILFSGCAALMYIITAAFLAEYYGLVADISWWIILWLVATLLMMATPPVAGGVVSCLSILLLQLHIPEEGLVIGAALTMLLDFILTATRVLLLHMEMLIQADRLGLLDKNILQKAE